MSITSRKRSRSLTMHLIAAQATMTLIASGHGCLKFNSRIVPAPSTNAGMSPLFSGRFQVHEGGVKYVQATLKQFLAALGVTAAIEDISIEVGKERSQVRFMLRLAAAVNWNRG